MLIVKEVYNMRYSANEKNLSFYYGAMGCGKTSKLIGDYYAVKDANFSAIVIKPGKDTKGSSGVISRAGGYIETAFLIGSNDNIFVMVEDYLVNVNEHLDFVLVDEVQFLEEHHIDEIVSLVDELGINVFCYGLMTDFQGNLFEGSRRLIEVGAELERLSIPCKCGAERTHNMRLENGKPVFEGEQVAIDGVEAVYEAVCRKCYNGAKRRVRSKLDSHQMIISGFEE